MTQPNRIFSKNQGISFNPISIEDQAYILDNFQLLTDMLDEHLSGKNDPLHNHWLNCLKTRYKEICEKVDLKR
ncbi:hypothetical protein ZPAH1_orf00355 [Aeromonas phage ZPAH1]|nr:hypothetical protein ASwh1_309 [Aeromonas phage Aswh_1]QQG34117.1 hypothetical protein ZPAH1_orf00355 [Aeromonas phage ZPAH1]